jgi:hypothetical protein
VLVKINGEDVSIGAFSAYKAFIAMDLVAAVEGVGRVVVSEVAEFKRAFEAENVVTLTRAEARRKFPPLPLYETVTDDETGAIIERPMMRDGEIVIGPDPLAHLTDADWEASGNVLTIPSSPTETMQIAAMVPKAFKLGRVETLRLLALITTSNRDLETWDEAGEDLEAKLDAGGKRLQHDCSTAEIIDLATAAILVCKEEISAPLARLRAQISQTFARPTEEPTETPIEPMTIEEAEPIDASDGPPISSGASPDGSGGTPAPSSTAPGSVSPPPSPIAS